MTRFARRTSLAADGNACAPAEPKGAGDARTGDESGVAGVAAMHDGDARRWRASAAAAVGSKPCDICRCRARGGRGSTRFFGSWPVPGSRTKNRGKKKKKKEECGGGWCGEGRDAPVRGGVARMPAAWFAGCSWLLLRSCGRRRRCRPCLPPLALLPLPASAASSRLRFAS